MKEEKLNKQIKKKLKNIEPNIEAFVPFTVSLYRLCEEGNKLQYFNQIRNRIYRELEADESLSNFVRIDPDNLEDLHLDNDGVLIFMEILNGYFEEKDIKDLWKYTKDLNKFKKSEYQLEHMFDNLTILELKAFIEKYLTYNANPGEEKAKQLLIDKATAELKKRRKFF